MLAAQIKLVSFNTRNDKKKHKRNIKVIREIAIKNEANFLIKLAILYQFNFQLWQYLMYCNRCVRQGCKFVRLFVCRSVRQIKEFFLFSFLSQAT